jgi:hypothetical protein
VIQTVFLVFPSVLGILGLITLINPRPLRSFVWALHGIIGWKPDTNHVFQSLGFFRLLGFFWLLMSLLFVPMFTIGPFARM